MMEAHLSKARLPTILPCASVLAHDRALDWPSTSSPPLYKQQTCVQSDAADELLYCNSNQDF